jgi:hypothetical protein
VNLYIFFSTKDKNKKKKNLNLFTKTIPHITHITVCYSMKVLEDSMLFSVAACLHFEIIRNINRVQIFQDHELVDCIKQRIKRIGAHFPSFCYLNEKLNSKKNLLYQRRRTNQQGRFSHHLVQSINHTNFSYTWFDILIRIHHHDQTNNKILFLILKI